MLKIKQIIKTPYRTLQGQRMNISNNLDYKYVRVCIQKRGPILCVSRYGIGLRFRIPVLWVGTCWGSVPQTMNTLGLAVSSSISELWVSLSETTRGRWGTNCQQRTVLPPLTNKGCRQNLPSLKDLGLHNMAFSLSWQVKYHMWGHKKCIVGITSNFTILFIILSQLRKNTANITIINISIWKFRSNLFMASQKFPYWCYHIMIMRPGLLWVWSSIRPPGRAAGFMHNVIT